MAGGNEERNGWEEQQYEFQDGRRDSSLLTPGNGRRDFSASVLLLWVMGVISPHWQSEAFLHAGHGGEG